MDLNFTKSLICKNRQNWTPQIFPINYCIAYMFWYIDSSILHKGVLAHQLFSHVSAKCFIRTAWHVWAYMVETMSRTISLCSSGVSRFLLCIPFAFYCIHDTSPHIRQNKFFCSTSFQLSQMKKCTRPCKLKSLISCTLCATLHKLEMIYQLSNTCNSLLTDRIRR